MSLQRIVISSAVRIRAIPPFKLSKSLFNDPWDYPKYRTFVSGFVKSCRQKTKARADSSPDPSSARTKCKNKSQSRFCQIQSPENSFGKTESAFRPATLPEYLYEQNPKKKNVLSILWKIYPRENMKKQGTFFLFGVAEWSEAVAGLSWSVRFNLEPPRAPRVRHHLFWK